MKNLKILLLFLIFFVSSLLFFAWLNTGQEIHVFSISLLAFLSTSISFSILYRERIAVFVTTFANKGRFQIVSAKGCALLVDTVTGSTWKTTTYDIIGPIEWLPMEMKQEPRSLVRSKAVKAGLIK